ncbi:unnamed protein product, partial [Brenthis ino]
MIEVYGAFDNTVMARDRKTLIYVFPVLYQHDLMGYCDVVLNYRCKKKVGILHAHLPFDTRVISKLTSNSVLKKYINTDKGVKCKTLDQDSLRKCCPANCDLKYSGKRPFYDEILHKCTEAPDCIAEGSKELPSIVYVPQINICKNLGQELSFQDIYALSTGLGTMSFTTEKVHNSKIELKSNCSTISQNLFLLRDLMYGKLCPCKEVIDFRDGCKLAVFRIILSVLSICAMLLSCVCCIHTIIWFHRQWLEGNIRNFMMKVRSKFKRTENIWRFKCNKRRRSQHNLLREVVARDIPIELRSNIASVCDRMQMEIQNQKRYRNSDIGSQISLQKEHLYN